MFGKKFFGTVALGSATVGLAGSATVCAAPPPWLVPQLAKEQLQGVVDFFGLSRDETVDMLHEVNNKLSQHNVSDFRESGFNPGELFSYVKKRLDGPEKLYVYVFSDRNVFENDEDPRYLEFFRKDRGYYRANFVELDIADLNSITFKK
jgi:hypothetical protein